MGRECDINRRRLLKLRTFGRGNRHGTLRRVAQNDLPEVSGGRPAYRDLHFSYSLRHADALGIHRGMAASFDNTVLRNCRNSAW